LLKSWSPSSFLSCALTKIPFFTLASHILGKFGHKYSKFRVIHYMLKQLNLRCSRLPTPKLDLYFRHYSKNTVREVLPRVSSVALCDFNTLGHKRNESCSAYMARTFHVAHQITGQLLRFPSYSTQGGGCKQTELLRDGAATYYHATFCNGHLITPTDSNRHIMGAAIFHIDILSE